MSGPRALAVGLMLLGLLGLVGLFACNQSVEGWLGEECRQPAPSAIRTATTPIATRAPPGERGRLRAGRGPFARRPPLDPRGALPALRRRHGRHRQRPRGRRRSIAYVSDERRGYGFFFPFVGGFWGSYTGPGSASAAAAPEAASEAAGDRRPGRVRARRTRLGDGRAGPRGGRRHRAGQPARRGH
jgi:hypothetical protein